MCAGATAAPALQAREIHKVFRSGDEEIVVLENVNIEVSRGEILAITGASGVGKSTLLHIMGTLERPTKGELQIDGQKVFELSETETAHFRNRHIGFVFQFHHLLPEFTAFENVLLPGMIAGVDVAELSRYATELLGSVGLQDRMEHRPGELSGGECQRVAVARALAMKPKIVLADEPSGNLDTASSATLHRMIKDLAKIENQTFVIMTHDQSLAGDADRVGKLESRSLHL
jgi:lipoprotein-releasing system ATP-binding protein